MPSPMPVGRNDMNKKKRSTMLSVRVVCDVYEPELDTTEKKRTILKGKKFKQIYDDGRM